MAGLLDKDRIIARPGFNRWLVPPAALAIHLSIGMAYGFSVFWLPLSRAIGITRPMPYPDDMGFWERILSSSYDWPISALGWMYTLFFVFLGGSAAVFGRWVERAGPRKAGVAAACCWGGGLALSALGVYVHQIWLLWLGSGVLGGVGLGLGYISPVSTLLKWFPDRRGLATGLAIMGFGGGAMIGAPLADRLMKHFASDVSVGVWQTFLVLAGVYFTAMLAGAFGYRVPPAGWRPGAVPAIQHALGGAPLARYVPVDRAIRVPQFWLLWLVLCLNVSAGIGVLGMASPMLQEVFGGRLIGVEAPLSSLSREQLGQVASIAAAFAGLLSLCNIVGRIAWASLSDVIGRKATYTIFFLLGAVLYAAAPAAARTANAALFVAIFCVILTMYGGGFATVPAYLADLFGPEHISAIHGRLLTAWSVAGVLGPVLVNYLRDWQLGQGVAPSAAYNTTLYVLTGLLVGGLVCNVLIRPVPEEDFLAVPGTASQGGSGPLPGEPGPLVGQAALAFTGSRRWLVILAWLAVGVPLAWGVWDTFGKARAFFE